MSLITHLFWLFLVELPVFITLGIPRFGSESNWLSAFTIPGPTWFISLGHTKLGPSLPHSDYLNMRQMNFESCSSTNKYIYNYQTNEINNLEIYIKENTIKQISENNRASLWLLISLKNKRIYVGSAGIIGRLDWRY